MKHLPKLFFLTTLLFSVNLIAEENFELQTYKCIEKNLRKVNKTDDLYLLKAKAIKRDCSNLHSKEIRDKDKKYTSYYKCYLKKMIASNTIIEAQNADLLCQALHKVKIERKSNQKIKKNALVKTNLRTYLENVSRQINLLASNNYPSESIKLKEQGEIVTIVKINNKGEVISLDFENEYPERLYLSAKTMLENYKFPEPPKNILDKNNSLHMKIPINYILR